MTDLTTGRMIVSIFILISVFTLPWYIPMAASLIAAFVFKWYAEAILAGVLIDILFSSGGQTMFGIHYALALISLVVVAITALLRSVLKFY